MRDSEKDGAGVSPRVGEQLPWSWKAAWLSEMAINERKD